MKKIVSDVSMDSQVFAVGIVGWRNEK